MAQAALASDRRVTQASGFTLWLTGLSGAGKSTLAVAVSQELRSRGAAVEGLGQLGRGKRDQEHRGDDRVQLA